MKPMKALSGLLAGLLLAAGALAQTFPSKPITLMVPYPAGGLSDIIASKVKPRWPRSWASR